MVPIVLQMPASTRRAYLVTTFKPEVHSALHRNKDTKRRSHSDSESKQLLSDGGSHIGGQRSLELRHSLKAAEITGTRACQCRRADNHNE